MKKKNLKSLRLNKKSISNLNPQKINGGGWTLFRWCRDTLENGDCPQLDTVEQCVTNDQSCRDATILGESCETCGTICPWIPW